MISTRLQAENRQSSGFTIIELLIATAVFSVILIIITTGIMAFTSSYYKGVNENNTQNVARTIINNIAQSIQFSSSSYPYYSLLPNGNNKGFCVNNVEYSYVLGKEVEPHPDGSGLQTPDALVTKPFASGSACSFASPLGISNPVGFTRTSKEQELLNKNMWLSDLTITSLSANTYSIEVVVAYGDADLLCSPSKVPSGAGSCTSTQPMPNQSDYVTPDIQCKGQKGSQFCAVSALSTVVQERLN